MKILLITIAVLSFLVLTTANAQFIQEGNKLVSTGTNDSTYQGGGCLSADGNTLVISGTGDNDNVGAIWVFTRSNSVWTQQGGKLVGTGAVGQSNQGSIAISGDGNTIIVGGAYDNNYVGAAWIFTRSNGVWTQQGSKLVGTGGVGQSYQGTGVAISADGNTVAMGAPGDNGDVGATWVFTRSGGVWTQQGSKLVGTGGIGSTYQDGGGLSADGNTLIVGGLGDNNYIGAAWIFTRSNGVWAQQGNKLVGTGVVGVARQGWSAAISADGTTAIVGGPSDSNNAGAAWVYTQSNGVWTQQGSKFTGAGAVGNPVCYGWSCSISGDGNTAIVGGVYDNYYLGGAWVYTRSGGVWSQQGNILYGTGAVGNSFQGSSVAISADGNTVGVGGPRDNNNTGAVWVFHKPNPPSIVSITDIPNDEGGKVRIKWNRIESDNAGYPPQTTSYGIWRKLPPMSSAKTHTPGTMRVANDTLGMLYDFLGSVIAVQSPQYNFVAPTLADSDQSGSYMETFLVTAHTADPNMYWISNSDSGYSVDNLAPASPKNLQAIMVTGAITLHWNPNSEPDFDLYVIYQKSSLSQPDSLIGTTRDTQFISTHAVPVTGCIYDVRAQDIHGNLSAPSGIQIPTGVGNSGELPRVFALDQNYPNPFNPTTLIRFALPTGSHVRLVIYDVLGQQVAILKDGYVDAGYHNVVWKPEVGSGIYFYRLEATPKNQFVKQFVETGKMIYVK